MKKEAQEFLEHLHGIAEYWAGVAEKTKPDYKSFADSVIFSVLADIDGCGMDNLILLYKTDDYGEPAECINNEDELHEGWYKR